MFAALLDPNENNGVAVLFVDPVVLDDEALLTRAENGVTVVNVDVSFRFLKIDDEPIVAAVLVGVSETGLLNENGVDEIDESFLLSFDCSFGFVTRGVSPKVIFGNEEEVAEAFSEPNLKIAVELAPVLRGGKPIVSFFFSSSILFDSVCLELNAFKLIVGIVVVAGFGVPKLRPAPADVFVLDDDVSSLLLEPNLKKPVVADPLLLVLLLLLLLLVN